MSDIPDRTIDSIEYRVGYQQGKLDAILNQANHDLAVKQAYELGLADGETKACSEGALRGAYEQGKEEGIAKGKEEAITELKEKYLDADSYNEGLDDGITDVLDVLERLDTQMLEKVKDVLYEQDYEEQKE